MIAATPLKACISELTRFSSPAPASFRFSLALSLPRFSDATFSSGAFERQMLSSPPTTLFHVFEISFARHFSAGHAAADTLSPTDAFTSFIFFISRCADAAFAFRRRFCCAATFRLRLSRRCELTAFSAFLRACFLRYADASQRHADTLMPPRRLPASI